MQRGLCQKKSLSWAKPLQTPRLQIPLVAEFPNTGHIEKENKFTYVLKQMVHFRRSLDKINSWS